MVYNFTIRTNLTYLFRYDMSHFLVNIHSYGNLITSCYSKYFYFDMAS